MPSLNIAPARPLDPTTGLPSYAATHVLTLCDRHLTDATRDVVKNRPDDVPACGGGVLAWRLKFDDDSLSLAIHLVSFTDGANVWELPADLRDCVVFAASRGFNAIRFETFDPDACPLVPSLPSYGP